VPDGTIEIITGRERRRRWGMAEKLRIVAESREPGTCVAAVAAAHDVSPSLLHGWRRQVREGRLGAAEASDFVPVRLAASLYDSRTAEHSPPPKPGEEPPPIEVVLASGSRILIHPGAPLPTLRAVIAALRG